MPREMNENFVGDATDNKDSLFDPIETKSNKRPADKEDESKGSTAPSITRSEMIAGIVKMVHGLPKENLGKAYSSVVNALGGPKGGLKESASANGSLIVEQVEDILVGQNLTEDFRKQFSAIFESAVNVAAGKKIAEAIDSLEEQFEERMSQINDSVNQQIAEGIAIWIDENQMAIKSSVKSDIAESFMEGLKALFEQHYIEMPESKVDIVEAMELQAAEMSEQITQLQEALAAAEETTAETVALAEAALVDADRKIALMEAAEALTVTDREKLIELTEGLEYQDAESFREKIQVIAETTFKPKRGNSSLLNEEVAVGSKPTTAISEEAAAVAAVAARMSAHY